MATKLTEHPSHYVIETMIGHGRSKRIPRHAVRKGKGDQAALIEALIESGKLARKLVGLDPEPVEPVD